MVKNIFSSALCILVVLFGTSIFSGCVSTKDAIYFADFPDTAKLMEVVPAEFKEPRIQPDDLLSISVQTIDPTSTISVNQGLTMQAVGASTASSVGNQTISGYLVDRNGDVDIPLLGKIKLQGLTTYEARELIHSKALNYYKSPTVQVRFANFKITVIGEVARPATYTVPNERISLLDALGLAGDLTIYGKRENVLLIRDHNGTKQFSRFNLNSTETLKSPYFYLRQNDVIYVEPGKGKVAATNSARTQTLAIIGSALSVLIVLISRL